jgi:hypothetical protein
MDGAPMSPLLLFLVPAAFAADAPSANAPLAAVSPPEGAVLAAPLTDGRPAPPESRALPGSAKPAVPNASDGELRDVAVGFDLVPFVGTSAVYRGQDRRAMSLSIFGYSGAIDGLDASLAGSAVVGDVDGVQISSGLNLVGANVDGLQFSGGANIVGGDMDGIQASAGANVVGGDVDGFQGAAGVNIAGGLVDGTQVAAGVNVAGDDVDGSQVAVLNIAAGDVKGVQVGIVNIAENSNASIGLVNIIRDGRKNVDLWTAESGFMLAGFKYGGRYLHNIYGFGWRPWGDCGEWSAVLGIGGHMPLNDRFAVDADLLLQHVSYEGTIVLDPNLLSTLRVQAVAGLGEHLALTAGLQANLWTSTVHNGAIYTAGGTGAVIDTAGSSHARAWPGFSVGVQLF